MRMLLLAVVLLVASPASAQVPLQQRVEATLAQAPRGTRFGLLVVDEAGRELIAINPDARFIPASNATLCTTAAAFASLPALDRPDAVGGASVRLDGRDVVLRGHGDARLSSAPDCVANCLAALADAVATRTRIVRDVVGDDSFFPDERWSPGMSWNNLHTRSGTATSALTLDDNELTIRVTPSAPGRAPTIATLPYYEIYNRALTVASGATGLTFDRLPGSMRVRLSGTIGVGSASATLRLAIDDPAHFAAWRLRSLLEARGVRVTGTVATRHRPPIPADDPSVRRGTPAARPPESDALARLTAPPLRDDLATINKTSQNLHAELLLRRIGRVAGTASIADGLAAVEAMMARAGVPRTGWDLSDGAGMSTYDRLAPRAVVTFLRWAAAQGWGPAWRETLPVAGVDGTLANRFRGTPLQGRLHAKTGSLHATNALSGTMVGRSGRTLTFSFFANDVPGGASAAAWMDAALVQVAEAN